MELKETGLKCDNPKCDWIDGTVTSENMSEHINRSCPRCGENVLTKEDFDNYMLVINAIKTLNNMSDEEIANLTKDLGEFNDDLYKMTFDTHKGISVKIELL